MQAVCSDYIGEDFKCFKVNFEKEKCVQLSGQNMTYTYVEEDMCVPF